MNELKSIFLTKRNNIIRDESYLKFLRVEFKRAENYWDHFKSTDFEDYKDDIKDFMAKGGQIEYI